MAASVLPMASKGTSGCERNLSVNSLASNCRIRSHSNCFPRLGVVGLANLGM